MFRKTKLNLPGANASMPALLDGYLMEAAILAEKHILIVEDEAYIALDLESVLSEAGANTTRAGASSEALNLIQCTHFDAAILDVHLHDENTYAVAEALRRKSTPFVFLSGYLTIREDYVGIPFLTKPYTAESVRSAIDAVLTSTP